MANRRVHEIAAEFGVESKVVLALLREMGEYVKGPSSSMAPPVARRLTARLRQGGATSRFPALALAADAAEDAVPLLGALPRSMPALLNVLSSAATAVRPGGRLLLQAAQSGCFYFVPSDVMASVTKAGRTRNRILAHDLPSPSGVAFVDFGDRSVRAIAWVSNSIELITGAATLSVETRPSSPPRSRLMLGPMDVVRVSMEGDAPRASSELRELIGVVASIPVRPSAGGTTKKAPMSGPPSASKEVAGGVHLVYATRGVTNEPRTPVTDRPVQRDSRWTVRGHWREQWYSSLETHRRVWIEEHPAGRPDAPIAARELVYIIRPHAIS